jgi:outer membrane immunogenic protein
MKRILSGLVLSALLAVPATAADLRRPMPVKAPVPIVTLYNWTGCYIGIHGGFAWARVRVHDTITGNTIDIDDDRHNLDGFLVGGTLGCNLWQGDRWVFGIEGQAAWADIDGERSVTPLTFPRIGHVHSEIDVIGSISARFGYAFGTTGQSLLFVKGGAAFVNLDHRFHRFTGPATFEVFESDSDLRWGWMVGGGWEQAFGGGWSFKAEYNFNHFGNRDVDVCFGGLCEPFEIKRHIHVVKFGINYKFGGWGGAPVAARY